MGGPGGSRTHARQIRRLLLYPLSYRAQQSMIVGEWDKPAIVTFGVVNRRSPRPSGNRL